ncbi:MAG: WbqC family protein [Cyclobacteriaceae bacterium]
MNSKDTLSKAGTSVLIEPHYLPNLEFFAAIFPYAEIVLDVHSHFVKQSWRSRSIVASANGPLMLIVPVTHKGNRTPLHEVITAENTRWRLNHWRTIESAYRNAPFFEYYSDELKKLILGPETSLHQINQNILSICLNWLGWNKKVKLSVSFIENFEGIDLRDHLESKVSFEKRPYLQPIPYRQVFGNAFAENMSVLDLVFCTGPEASGILQRSTMGFERLNNK